MSRKVLCHDSKDWTYECDIFKNGTLQKSSMSEKKRSISSVESLEEVFEHFKTLSLSEKPLSFLVFKNENNDDSSQNNNNSSQINYNISSPINNNNSDPIVNNNSKLENKMHGEISPKLTRPPCSLLPAADDEDKAPALRRPSLSFLQKNPPAGGQKRGTPDGENTLARSGTCEDEKWGTIAVQDIAAAVDKESPPPKLRRPTLQVMRNAPAARHDEKNLERLECRPIWRRFAYPDQSKKFTLISNLDTEMSRIRDMFSRKKVEVHSNKYGIDSSDLPIGCGNRKIGARKTEELYIPPHRRNVKSEEIKENVAPLKSVEVKVPFKRGYTPDAKPQTTYSRGYSEDMMRIQRGENRQSQAGYSRDTMQYQKGENRQAQAAQERLEKIKIELANC